MWVWCVWGAWGGGRRKGAAPLGRTGCKRDGTGKTVRQHLRSLRCATGSESGGARVGRLGRGGARGRAYDVGLERGEVGQVGTPANEGDRGGEGRRMKRVDQAGRATGGGALPRRGWQSRGKEGRGGGEEGRSGGEEGEGRGGEGGEGYR